MRQSRVYTQQPLAGADHVDLQGAAAHYLVRVLRVSVGTTLTLFNGDGRDYCGEVCEVQRQRVAVEISRSWQPENESSQEITLVQSVSRGERMDYSLQKATELGVVCIQPLMSQRVEVKLDQKRLAKRLSHWRGVVISACEQSGRAIIPRIRTPLSLPEWLAIGDKSQRLVLDPGAGLKLSSLRGFDGPVSLLVGPEGGLSRDELVHAQSMGVKAVSLGPRVLRTETAGPAAIAVLQALAGDL